jgi:hypothetical protein
LKNPEEDYFLNFLFLNYLLSSLVNQRCLQLALINNNCIDEKDRKLLLFYYYYRIPLNHGAAVFGDGVLGHFLHQLIKGCLPFPANALLIPTRDFKNGKGKRVGNEFFIRLNRLDYAISQCV